MVDAIPDMGNGAHATQESEYLNYLNKLFAEAQALWIVNVKKLNDIPAKDIYADFTVWHSIDQFVVLKLRTVHDFKVGTSPLL